MENPNINFAVPNKKDIECDCCDEKTMLYDIMINHGDHNVCRFVLQNSINKKAIIRKINTYSNNKVQLCKFAIDNGVNISLLSICDNDRKILDKYIANKLWWDKVKIVTIGVILIGIILLPKNK